MDLSSINGLITNAEYPIIAVFVASVTQNIKQTAVPNEYLPFVAALIGLAGGLVATYITGGDNYAGAAVYGLITGMTTSGIYDAGKTVVNKVAAKSAAKATTVAATDPQARVEEATK